MSCPHRFGLLPTTALVYRKATGAVDLVPVMDPTTGRSGAQRERSRCGAEWAALGQSGSGDGDPLRVPGAVPCAKRGATSKPVSRPTVAALLLYQTLQTQV